MFDKLEGVERRFSELEDSLASGTLKPVDMTRLTKERSALESLVDAYRRYKSLKRRRDDAKTMLQVESDSDMRAMAKEELGELETLIAASEQELLILSLPKDPNDQRNVILEVRAGTGGEEAALFAADLFRMYTRFADRQRWKTEVLSATESWDPLESTCRHASLSIL